MATAVAEVGGEIMAADEIDGGDRSGGGDALMMDYDAIMNILEEPSPEDDPYNNQGGSEGFSLDNLEVESDTYVGNQNNFQLQNGDSLIAYSDDVSGKHLPQSRYPLNNCSGSFREWCSSYEGDRGTDGFELLQPEMHSCSTTTGFVEGDSNYVSHHGDDLVLDLLLTGSETGSQFRHVGGAVDSNDISPRHRMDHMNGKLEFLGSSVRNSSGNLGSKNEINTSMDMSFMDADNSLHDIASTEPAVCHGSDVSSDIGTFCSDMQFGINEDDRGFAGSPSQYYFPGDFSVGLFPGNEVSMVNRTDEAAPFHPEGACSLSDISMISRPDLRGLDFKCDGGDVMSPASRNFPSNADNRLIDHKSSVIPFSYDQQGISKKNIDYSKDKKGDFSAASEIGQLDGINGRFQINGGHSDLNFPELCLPAHPFIVGNSQLGYVNDERLGKLIQPKGFELNLSRVSPESIQSNSSGSKSHVDYDSDICIIEDISQPACSNQSLSLGKAVVPLQNSAYSDSFNCNAMAGTRLRVNDERFIFQAALQDLSQPKSEATPPDGVLAVPLLRHQRIALSWMVQKETSSLYCSGGILADDQGLGKTVSTIALILKERPPPLREDSKIVKKEEFETLDLDKDDDEVIEVGGNKQAADYCQVTSNSGLTKSLSSFGQSKGRPAAGTLIVCPTSVLRQWAEELHKKVTSEANLSVLVYHGSNRTKDPCELAKYDVVLTTYSIVSMEVPKQPLVDEDDEEKIKMEGDNVPQLGFSSGKKRKYPPNSGKKGSKKKKEMDGALFESLARPLAKVAWFRVVLDEAQSIKNHRTQVARACWGLRAKRRWCLSGTPIQNAIDDLYSYFRFLRYDPFVGYKAFCTSIKMPIQKSPAKGYRKLQAILKTIMLRRTKGTLIDGEPIINLPPKVIELKKVDFTEEERYFYTRLETESRDQFREYAAAGTVKQNYVNILLMLLRLRQACDHPFLVKGLDSNSLGRSSIDVAKKLPLEKQICLLKHLEASLAICGICNDPPEDAVVSVCGHVFCNQCICEHLTGDDNQCPTPKCKVRLNASSIFSKATLSSSLSDGPGEDGSGYVESGNTCPESWPYDSSKIRAALEFLQSLTKPQDLSTNSCLDNSSNNGATCLENSSGSASLANDNGDKKIVVVDKSVNDSVKVVGEKAIVFSQWTGMLDLLEACLKSSSIKYRRLDGTMSVVARDKAVKDFNTLPEVSVMIMSLKAASLGLNMVAACHVLLLDLWWNPTTEDQAIDRAHRIGQTRPVTVLRLTVKDTVEDRILALQQKKREMVASAFGEDETGGRQTRLTVEDLNYLFMA